MHCSRLHRSLSEFRRDGSYCDITIRIQNTTTSCHRVVLAGVSEVFDVMFRGSFNESTKKEIVLHEIDPLAFESILEFAYLDKKPNFFEPTNNVYDILKACDFLKVTDLIEPCIRHIIEHTSLIKNVCEIFVFSSICNYPRLCNSLGSYIVDNFHIISQDKEFYALSFEQLNIVMENYQSLRSKSVESSVFNDEDLLLDAIIRWIFYAFQERKEYSLELTSVVNIEKVSKNYLDFLSNEYKMRLGIDLKSCLKTFFASETRHAPPTVVYLDPVNNSALHVYVSNKRYQEIGVLSVSKYQQKFQWSSIERENLGSLKSKLSNNGVKMVTLDKPYNYLYCLSRDCSFSSYSSINFDEKKTLKIPNINWSDFSTMCGFQNNSIYYYDYINSAEDVIICYKCELDEWVMVPKMKTSELNAKLVADSEILYLIGLSNEETNYCTRYVRAFDHRIPRWMELTKPETGPSDFTLYCHLNGKIYASDAKQMEVFDSLTGKWRILSYNNYVPNPIEIDEMVPFEESIWIFYRKIIAGYVQPERRCIIFNPHTVTWLPFDSFRDNIKNVSSYSNTIVFKPLD